MSGPEPFVIVLAGDIDNSRYPEMRAAFGAAADGRGPVLVDLGDLHYVDSYFLSELMMFARKCEAMERPLVALSPDPFVARTFGIAGVANRIALYVDRAVALSALRQRSAELHGEP